MTSEEYANSSVDYRLSRDNSSQLGYKVSVKSLNSWFGEKQALKDINFSVKEKTITSLIGQSG